VTVALRGRTMDFPPALHKTKIKLDQTPPVLCITNPSDSIVTRPYLQLQGYANEPLSTAFYAEMSAT